MLKVSLIMLGLISPINWTYGTITQPPAFSGINKRFQEKFSLPVSGKSASRFYKPGNNVEFIKNKDFLTVSTLDVAIRNNETLDSILKRNGIFQDPDALGIIKLLNPDIADLNNLKSGSIIKIPSVLGDKNKEISDLLRRGFLSTVSMEAFLNARIENQSTSLKQISEKVESRDAGLFGGEFKKEFFRSTLKKTSTNLDRIKKYKSLIPEMVLIARESESKLIKEEIEAVLNSITPPSEESIEKINVLSDSLDELSSYEAIDKPVEVKVEIQTWKHDPQNLNKIPYVNLKPYFMTQAQYYYWSRSGRNYDKLKDISTSFPGVTSPASETFNEADFVFWVSKYDDPKRKPLGNEMKEIKIRKNQKPIEFEVG